jgi:uncharacterized protein YlxW (UPF0749 family)
VSARRRPGFWSTLVPVVALLAGLLFATSGQTAQGTDLRAGETAELSGLISQRNAAIDRQTAELAALRARVEQLNRLIAGRDDEVRAAQVEGQQGELSAGLVALAGPGLEVTLDDAPRPADGSLPNGARADDVVIHQSDVQAVVNALWAAGADGVAVMGQRLIATSAVRCVGNTLLLQGRTYSPPFVVTAIGDVPAMRTALAASEDVEVFRLAVDRFGLTFRLRDRAELVLPAYDRAPDLRYARAA